MQDALYRKGKEIRGKVLGEGREAEIARTEDAFSMPLREFRRATCGASYGRARACR